MDKFLELRKALEGGREKQALELFNHLYDRKKEFHALFRQFALVAAQHRPRGREQHAFLPLNAALQSMQFLRTGEEVALMARRLVQYLCAVEKTAELETWTGEEDFREHAAELTRRAGYALEKNPRAFVFNAAVKELADYVGAPEAYHLLPLMEGTEAEAPEKTRTPKKGADAVLLDAAARGELVLANALLKTRRLFSPQMERHLLAVLEKTPGKGKALTEKEVDKSIGRTHGELSGSLDDVDALLAHALEPNLAHGLYALRGLIAQKASLRALYPALLLGSYYCGPAGNLDTLVRVNAACQLAERIEKPHALIPLAQGLLAIAEKLKAGKRMEIPSKIVFPWE